MIATADLIRELEHYGAFVEIEGSQLKLIRGKLLSPSLLDKIRAHKGEIIELLSKDQKARSAGFLSLHIGTVYERQYSPASHVFVILEAGKWSSHRETWSQGRSQSVSYKQIAERVSFDRALLKAKQYIGYVSRGNRH